MPRLVLFFICLAVLGFSFSARLGLLLSAAAAAVWAVSTVAALWRIVMTQPRRARR